VTSLVPVVLHTAAVAARNDIVVDAAGVELQPGVLSELAFAEVQTELQDCFPGEFVDRFLVVRFVAMQHAVPDQLAAGIAVVSLFCALATQSVDPAASDCAHSVAVGWRYLHLGRGRGLPSVELVIESF
jgi:hypothetical protein